MENEQSYATDQVDEFTQLLVSSQQLMASRINLRHLENQSETLLCEAYSLTRLSKELLEERHPLAYDSTSDRHPLTPLKRKIEVPSCDELQLSRERTNRPRKNPAQRKTAPPPVPLFNAHAQITPLKLAKSAHQLAVLENKLLRLRLREVDEGTAACSTMIRG